MMFVQCITHLRKNKCSHYLGCKRRPVPIYNDSLNDDVINDETHEQNILMHHLSLIFSFPLEAFLDSCHLTLRTHVLQASS